jgi:hypothetical protein
MEAFPGWSPRGEMVSWAAVSIVLNYLFTTT